MTNNIYKSTCECGEKLDYAKTPFMTNEKRVCRSCGRIHFVDSAPIDWIKIYVKSRGENK